MSSACIFGITGYSGSGKTTLIEKLLPELKSRGFRVCVIKHIHHKLDIDVAGKDTDRFYRAGADVVYAHDAVQGYMRSPYRNEDLNALTARLPCALDLIIIEGHKDYAVPGIWLEKNGSGRPEKTALYGGKVLIRRSDPQYLQRALDHIVLEMEKFHAGRTIYAGLLIGGKSRRMGTPKSLLKTGGRTLASRSFDTLSSVCKRTVLLGSGPIPASLLEADRLADVPDVNGPLAGMLSAFRWAPNSAWIISSVDMPLMRKEAWGWLLSNRKPGVWAVLPKIKGSKGVETTGAVYEPMIFGHMEALASQGGAKLQEVTLHPKVITPIIPGPLIDAWENVNTRSEWEKAVQRDMKKR